MGSIFHWGKNSFFRAKNFNVSPLLAPTVQTTLTERMFLQTLESGIVVGQGIKVVPGKCVKNNKRKDWTIWQTELSMGKFQNSINVWPLTLTMQCGIFGGVFFLGEMKFVFF